MLAAFRSVQGRRRIDRPEALALVESLGEGCRAVWEDARSSQTERAITSMADRWFKEGISGL